MNSNLFFILICSSLISACGVKAPPRRFPDTIVESYVKQYTVEPDPLVNKDPNQPVSPAPKN